MGYWGSAPEFPLRTERRLDPSRRGEVGCSGTGLSSSCETGGRTYGRNTCRGSVRTGRRRRWSRRGTRSTDSWSSRVWYLMGWTGYCRSSVRGHSSSCGDGHTGRRTVHSDRTLVFPGSCSPNRSLRNGDGGRTVERPFYV